MTKRTLTLPLALLMALCLCVPALAEGPVPEAETVPEAEPAPETETTPEPEVTPEPEPVPEKEAAPEAEVTPKTETTPEPEATPEAETVSEAEAVPDAAPASETNDGFRQSMARTLLDLVNDLRLNDAWYWKDNDRTVQQLSLSALAYDAALETQAMTCAQSLAARGSFTKPGAAYVFVTGPITAEAAFQRLAGEGGTYKGQADRRVMLRTDLTAMGAACYAHEGRFAWVLLFDSTSAGGELPPPQDSGSGVTASGSGWTLYDGGLLVISGSGPMADYCYDDAGYAPAPWFDFASDITALQVQEGVTSIGANAFSACWSLREVSLPASLRSIGDNAFNWCCALEQIALPAGLSSIGGFAFSSCTSLRRIAVPEGVVSLGEGAFCGCESMTAAELPASLCSIGGSAFEMCPSVTICAPGGSPAALYARQQGIALAPTESIGDINGDGATDRLDAVLLFRMVTGQQAAADLVTCDLDRDLRLDLKDVTWLWQKTA